MPESDPHFPQLSHASREKVFERLQKALNDMATYIPSAKQNPFWKTRVVNSVWKGWEYWAFMNGWSEDYDFPTIQECFDSVIEELGILARVILLDPRLQIEVVPDPSNGFPVYAFFPMHRRRWTTKWIEVRRTTRVLLLLSQPDIEAISKEEAKDQLRHHLGHALLYLREPKAKNECAAANDEWERGTKMEDFIG